MFAGRGCSGGFIVSSVDQRGEAAAGVSSLRALPTCCEHLEGWTLADSESAAGGSSFSPLTTEERLQRWLPRFLRLRERKSCSGSFLVVSITCCEHLNG